MKKILASVAVGALVLGAALFSGAPQAADAQSTARSFNGSYSIIFRGINAGDFNLAFNSNGSTYTATASRRATGAVRTMVNNKQDFTYSTRGSVAGGQLRPVAYRHSGGSKGRVVNVAFTASNVVTTANPAMGMGDPPATLAQKLGAVDQVTALAAMMTASSDPCNRTIKVLLEGRAVFNFAMSPNGTQAVNTRAFRGNAVRCRVRFQPVAGFSDPQSPANMTFLFAPASNGIYAPLRVEMPTEDGLAVLQVRSYTIG
jgi:hypothetical protein